MISSMNNLDNTAMGFLSRIEYVPLGKTREYKTVNISGTVDAGILDINQWVTMGSGLILGEKIHYFSTEGLIQVSSTLAADNDGATIGARSVRVVGRDNNYDQVFEDISLNGQTAVSSTQAFWRVTNVSVLFVGASAEGNFGKIYVSPDTEPLSSGKPTDTTHIMTVIQAGQNTSNITTMTTGAAESFYGSHFNFSSGSSSNKAFSIAVRILMRPCHPTAFGGFNNFWYTAAQFTLVDSVLLSANGFGTIPTEADGLHQDIEVEARIEDDPGGGATPPSCSLFYNGGLVRART